MGQLVGEGSQRENCTRRLESSQASEDQYEFDIIWTESHVLPVPWIVELGDEFKAEFLELHEEVQDEILAVTRLLEQFGPQLKRPHADTLNGSRYTNMKELRIHAADGAWRIAFAFDPRRKAVLFVAGDKSGGSEARFYRELIQRADARFGAHPARLKK
jgi:hypothetical protein